MSVSVCSSEAAHLLQIPHNQIANEIPDWISRVMPEYSVSLGVTAGWLIPPQPRPAREGPPQMRHDEVLFCDSAKLQNLSCVFADRVADETR